MSLSKPTLAAIKQYNSLDDVILAMAHIFLDAQMTLSGHRKLVMLMRNVQIKAISMGYEETFNFQFTKLISKILKLKKGNPAADRIAKFCSVFVASILKEEGENPTTRPEGALSEEGEELESVASEFVDTLIRHLLRGIESKFKEVRYRVVQMLAYLVNYITEIDEQLFKALHYSLNRRLYDREAIVRIQAVVAISRFQYFDESDGLLNPATKSLIAALKHDDSPEVRRAALLNLVKNEFSIPEMLARARDINAINRRLVYSRISKEISLGDIDLRLRDSLLNWGLNDRDPSVKHAAITMLTKTWLPHARDDLLELIENLQVIGSDAASLAMNVLFEQKPDRLDALEVLPDFWKELTVEKAFYIRTYFDFCNHKKLYNNIERTIPELTRLAHILLEYLRLREKIIESNATQIEEYRAHKVKLERFSQLLRETNAENLELKRRVTKEELLVEQLRIQIDEAKAASATLRERIQAESSASNTQSRIDLKDISTSLEELTSAKDGYILSIDQNNERIKLLATILNHRANERDKYVESSSELEENYRPLGDQIGELEFVIEQLLLVIFGCDFADVAGTRRLMPIITQALTNDNLSDRLVSVCVKILRKASIDEKYFSQLCTEIITDIRDSALDENDETFVSAVSLFNEEGDTPAPESEATSDTEDSSAEGSKRRKIAPALPPDNLLIQCLVILQYYLEIAEDTLANIHQLESLIDTLIRPAISNSLNLTIRHLGYRTLGLFSLIDKGLGTSNLKFFGMSASKAQDEDLKVLSTKIIFDILSTHGVAILDSEDDDSVDSLSLARLFYSLLKSYEMPHLQAVVAEGLCKLYLANMLADFGKGELSGNDQEEVAQETQLLEALLLSYFHPLNLDNQELKQTLAFCIPVYSFSHTRHQSKISLLSGDCFYRIFRKDSSFGTYESIGSPAAIVQQLIYWCDPNNVVNATPEEVRKNPSHFWQALKLLQVVEQDTPKSVKKAVIQNLSKLYLSEDLGSSMLVGLKNALDDTRQLISQNQDTSDFVLDAPTEKSFEKFYTSVADILGKAEAAEATRTPVLVQSRASSVSSQREPELKEEEPENGHLDVDNAHVNGVASDEQNSNIGGGGEEAEVLRPVVPNLAQIDEMLDYEDQVEYDIEMEPDTAHND